MKFNFAGTKHVQILKWLVIAIPAFAALYDGIASALGLPFGSVAVEIAGYATVFVMVLVGLAKPDMEGTE